MTLLRTCVGTIALVLTAAALSSSQAADPPACVGPNPKLWKQTIDKATGYLKTAQAEDGTWSKATNDGITSVVLLGLLRTGEVAADDPLVNKSMKYVASLENKESGHLASGAKDHLQNYLTSINLLALQQSDAKKYEATIKKAAAFLKAMPYDEKKDKKPEDVFYGGVGYGGDTRPDMSNTIFCLEALRAGGVPKDDPIFKKVLVYVSRSQNLAGEYNDQPWAGKINDGSFNYGAGPASQSKAKDAPADTPRPGYGAMTCAGLLALDACGVDHKDPRFQKAWEWLQKEYTVDVDPGMPAGRGGVGYLYYLQALAKCLHMMGVDEITDGKGKKHDWRGDHHCPGDSPAEGWALGERDGSLHGRQQRPGHRLGVDRAKLLQAEGEVGSAGIRGGRPSPDASGSTRQ